MRIAKEKHSSLVGPFVSYEENEVFWKLLLEAYLQHYIFFESYEMGQIS